MTGWSRRKTRNTSQLPTREKALLTLAKMLKNERLPPSQEEAVRELVSLLLHAERDRDEAQTQLASLIEKIKKSCDINLIRELKKHAKEIPGEKTI